jgi:hypothetical protein
MAAISVCGLALLALCPSAAGAFTYSGAGMRAGFLDAQDADVAPVISGHVEFEQSGTRWNFMPSISYWDGGRLSDLMGNFDTYYDLGDGSLVSPYLGAGVGLHHFDFEGPGESSTHLGANLFGGVRLPGPSNHYFLEGRYTASRYSQIAILAGLTFGYAR